jgi:hypothetical protein
MATLQENKIKEGVHLVVPSEFANFFIAGTSAGAALVGLLFVAVSIAPEQMVARRAPMERQAVAGSAFTALMNAFFISFVALIPHVNLGSLILPFSILALVSSVFQTRALLRPRKSWPSFLRRAFLALSSLVLYGFEVIYAVNLITNPSQVGFVYALVFLLLSVFAIGLVRAWELLGAQRYGFIGWLTPLHDLNEAELLSLADNSDSASGPPKTGEAASRPPSQ